MHIDLLESKRSILSPRARYSMCQGLLYLDRRNAEEKVSSYSLQVLYTPFRLSLDGQSANSLTHHSACYTVVSSKRAQCCDMNQFKSDYLTGKSPPQDCNEMGLLGFYLRDGP
jgi:hypothetical protein